MGRNSSQFRGFKMCLHNDLFNKLLETYPATMPTAVNGNPRSISVQSEPRLKAATINNIHLGIKKMQYAVRGPIVVRAGELEKELKAGVKKPFDKVIRANIGDSQAMRQKPITFIRQVLALVSYPQLLCDSRFPEDAKLRAKCILSSCKGGSAGSYTDSPGIALIRKQIAKYIEARDGIATNWHKVFIFNGASSAIKGVLKMLNEDVDGKKAGVMIPIPMYPLYSATIDEFRMEEVGYYLHEEKGWGLEVEELERAYEEGRKTCHPRAICVINPGNPTGQLLTKENIENVIKFAQKHDLFLFADEVYQYNIYEEGSEFHSFKKVSTQMGHPYNEVELASFMSVSKGYTGECGLRGGCVEIVNMDPEVMEMFKKCTSPMLGSNVIGQTAMYCVVKPPVPGDPSYEKFKSEKDEILKSLALRAKMVTETFNSFPNMSCQKIQGAMYAFPRITMPEKAISVAESSNLSPSAMYCKELLEETGVCVVAGSGFQQQPGTHHFRTTILPQPDDLKVMLEKMKEFHVKFLEKYS